MYLEEVLDIFFVINTIHLQGKLGCTLDNEVWIKKQIKSYFLSTFAQMQRADQNLMNSVRFYQLFHGGRYKNLLKNCRIKGKFISKEKLNQACGFQGLTNRIWCNWMQFP